MNAVAHAMSESVTSVTIVLAKSINEGWKTHYWQRLRAFFARS